LFVEIPVRFVIDLKTVLRLEKGIAMVRGAHGRQVSYTGMIMVFENNRKVDVWVERRSLCPVKKWFYRSISDPTAGSSSRENLEKNQRDRLFIAC